MLPLDNEGGGGLTLLSLINILWLEPYSVGTCIVKTISQPCTQVSVIDSKMLSMGRAVAAVEIGL